MQRLPYLHHRHLHHRHLHPQHFVASDEGKVVPLLSHVFGELIVAGNEAGRKLELSILLEKIICGVCGIESLRQHLLELDRKLHEIM